MLRTPVLDTETRVLSETFQIPAGTAREILRLIMARLNRDTFRELLIETVQLDLHTSAMQLDQTRPPSN